ncbi:KAT8 regulatory NSL complex subunit 3 [Octopus bimaculoides]|uniref:KAT8 regulatory NSL complex subunit 3 n=1 Tax=Octopus bimaculoides TaxID=37653 RepID=UPI00071E5D66|nr:KAT8 regulatory NSL complex subunit 3 [Octopus bimaculoides]|eukprot:XP_014777287.1 PREDICTED: KAT8 regulatory NSL complex subunit 3-like [Octopus bimaculoides]
MSLLSRSRNRLTTSTLNSERFIEEYQSHRHKLSTAYQYHLAGHEQDLDIVSLDHCYAKPWSAHPDASNAKPLRMLFMHKFPRNADIDQNSVDEDQILDVETTTVKSSHIGDVAKARSLMNECERHVSLAYPDKGGEDSEEHISKTGWTMQQKRLYNKVMKALHVDRLARLAFDGSNNEAVMRRIHVDKSSKRIRQALASEIWDPKLSQWLHNVLLENLPRHLLAAYLDVLQTLRAKIPTLVDRMIAQSAAITRQGSAVSLDALNLLLKRPWDPVYSTLSQQKPRKLPGNPLILVAPSGPTYPNNNYSKRTKFCITQLSNLGKVIPVTMHTVNGGSGVGIAQCLEHMIGAVRTKVLELKGHFQNRPIVLLGWNIGALVACHVSLVEMVSAVICLGFPLTGINGGRGDVEDPLLESKTSTLFVIGQHSNSCDIDGIEDLREKMKAENSLVVIGGADDNLRVSRAKKKQEGITQCTVDRFILDEVSEFLGSVLSQSVSQTENAELTDIDLKKKKRRKVSREAASSVNMEALSYSSNKFSVRSENSKFIPASKGTTVSRLLKVMRQTPQLSDSAESKLGDESSDGSIAEPLSPAKTQVVARRQTHRKRQAAVSLAFDSNTKKRIFRLADGSPSSSPLSTFKSTAGSPSVPSSSPSPATLLPVVSSAPELSGLLQCPPSSASYLTNSKLQSLTSGGELETKPKTALVVTKPEAQNLNIVSTASSMTSSILSEQKHSSSLNKPVSAQLFTKLPQASSSHISLPTGLGSIYTVSHTGPRGTTVHITTAASSPQIQQLLTSIAKSSCSPISITVCSAKGSSSSSNSQTSTCPTLSLGQPITTASGKPKAANSNPALTSVQQISNNNSNTSGITINPPDQEKVQAIQKLQFHDFPLTTAVLTKSTGTPTITQAKILCNSQLDLGKLQALSESASGKQTTLHISLNRGNLTTAGGSISSHNLSGITTIAKSTSSTSLTSTTAVSSILPMSSSMLSSGASSTGNIKTSLMSDAVGEYLVTKSEPLGRVSSLLESVKTRTVEVAGTSVQTGQPSFMSSNSGKSSVVVGQQVKQVTSPNTTVATVVGALPAIASDSSSLTDPLTSRTGIGLPRANIVSYKATPKTILSSTVAATRTRRIKTPKQYDL